MTVFGLLVERRIFLFLRSRHRWAVFSRSPTSIVTYVCISFLALEIDVLKTNVGLLLQLATLGGLIAKHFLEVQRQQELLRQGFQGWMENLILRLKMGESFRSAYRACVGRCPEPHLKMILSRQEIGFQLGLTDAVTPAIVSTPPFFRDVFRRIQEIDSLPHRVQARLELLLENWRQEIFFRRKSRQASRQHLIQLVFLGAMYLGLIVWGVHRYPTDRFWPSLRLSFFFVLGGVLTLLFLRRRKPWKI